jgi:hypothetical protein
MIDPTPLYDPIKHRYKGVYRAPNGRWDAIVQTPEGKLQRLPRGRYYCQEEAARAVAAYYEAVYGKDWVEAIKDRQRLTWRIKRVVRLLHMGALHRGPRTIVYAAYAKIRGGGWHKITPPDILPPGSNASLVVAMWHEEAGGWNDTATALVAIRMFRAEIARRTRSRESA